MEKKKRRMKRLPAEHWLITEDNTNRRIRLARYNLYEKLDGNNAPCHWCDKPIQWTRGKQKGSDMLCADHLDGDHTNDDPDNLVPACRYCNGMRSRTTAESKPVIEPYPCPTCGELFRPRARTRKYWSSHCFQQRNRVCK